MFKSVLTSFAFLVAVLAGALLMSREQSAQAAADAPAAPARDTASSRSEVGAGAGRIGASRTPLLTQDTVSAPPFTHTKAEDWLNSPPLKWAELRGRVVLIDVWTFDCWNCYRSIPWLHTLEEKFADKEFEIVGVHTPELPQEYVLANVKAKLKEFKITHPVMLDNDYSYWKALSNRYWPAFYLVDRQGRVRGRFIGETHVGDRNARQVEAQIAELLAESAAR